ncbi:hypothetical protein [Coralliovum pocilloporae]|uniref:hypothetical protein n=1 Tax=Coralliovum pocilloporae TaxID=3066369 RepID=UPI003307B81B
MTDTQGLPIPTPDLCSLPDDIHPVCQRLLDQFFAGEISIFSPAFACNMVDSDLIPLVTCLLNAYADGRLDVLHL